MMAPLNRFRRELEASESGFSMIEFALAAPLMVALMMGGFEVANLAITHMRVSEIANTVSDNAGRVMHGMSESSVHEIFAGAEVLGRAIDFEPDGRVVLSSLQENDRKNKHAGQMIAWQRCWGDLNVEPKYGKQGEGKNKATLPNGLGPAGKEIKSVNGNAVMFAEVSYRYKPVFPNGIFKPRTIRYETAFNVRDSSNREISNDERLPVMSC